MSTERDSVNVLVIGEIRFRSDQDNLGGADVGVKEVADRIGSGGGGGGDSSRGLGGGTSGIEGGDGISTGGGGGKIVGGGAKYALGPEGIRSLLGPAGGTRPCNGTATGIGLADIREAKLGTGLISVSLNREA